MPEWSARGCPATWRHSRGGAGGEAEAAGRSLCRAFKERRGPTCSTAPFRASCSIVAGRNAGRLRVDRGRQGRAHVGHGEACLAADRRPGGGAVARLGGERGRGAWARSDRGG